MNLKITPVPAFQDNYIWLLEPGGSNRVSVVDPGDAQPVLSLLEERQLELDTILITHHHADHTGGIDALLQRFPGAQVYGPAGSTIKGITRPMRDGDPLSLCRHDFTVLTVPGHTLDHIAYYSANAGPGDSGVLFCGDTLFAGGCGRLFEGTPEAMHGSLSRLAALPADTRIYCAHEYTLANLQFSLAVEPENEDTAQRLKNDTQARNAGLPTLPSTIGLELRTNPFLRCHMEVIQRRVRARVGADSTTGSSVDCSTDSPEVEIFTHLRQWKDTFTA